MKKVFWILLTLLVGGGAALWWYVRKDNNMYRLVPGDAHVVLSLSIPALLSEVSVNELSGKFSTDTIKNMFFDKADSLVVKRVMELRKSGSNFGVDYLSDVVFFTTRYEGLDFNGLVFDIADPAEFRKLLNAIDPGLIVDMKANYSVLNLSDGLFLAWNKRGGIVVSNDYSYAYARNIIRSNFIVETFSRPEGKSILAVKEYTSNKQDDYLLNMYVNLMAMDTAKYREYEDGEEVLRKRDYPFVSKDFVKSFAIGGIKHKNQALQLDTKFLSWDTGLPLASGYKANGISEQHARALVASNPILAMTVAERNESADSLFVNPDMKEVWDECMATMEWSEQELKSLLRAEMSFSFHGITRVPFDPSVDQLPYTRSLIGSDENGNVFTKTPSFTMEIVHPDSALLRRSLNKLLQFTDYFQHKNDHYYAAYGGFGAHVKLTSRGIGITNSTAYLSAFDQPDLNIKNDVVLNGVTNQQVFFYLNANTSSYNTETIEFMESFGSAWSNTNPYLNQIDNIAMQFKENSMLMTIQFKEGEEKLLDRLFHIMDAIRNPNVS